MGMLWQHLNHCRREQSPGCQHAGREGTAWPAGQGVRVGADAVQAELSRVQAPCRVQEGLVGAGGALARCRQG